MIKWLTIVSYYVKESVLITYTRHLFKLFVFQLIVSAVIMCVLVHRVLTQEALHQNGAVVRAAEATAREIELYIGNLQRSLQVFSAEQRVLLTDALHNPLIADDLQDKISLYFPGHLAFALSDPVAVAPLVMHRRCLEVTVKLI